MTRTTNQIWCGLSKPNTLINDCSLSIFTSFLTRYSKFIVFVTRLGSLLGALQLTWKSASDSVAWEKTKKIYILELLK